MRKGVVSEVYITYSERVYSKIYIFRNINLSGLELQLKKKLLIPSNCPGNMPVTSNGDAESQSS